MASAALLVGLGFLATLRKRRYLLTGGRGAWMLLLLIVLLGGVAATEIAGCGGSSKKTPVGSSTITVTATAGSNVQTGSLTLTVN